MGYKVGDKVRIIEDENGAPVGTVVLVKEVEDTGSDYDCLYYDYVDEDGDEHKYGASLDAVEPEEVDLVNHPPHYTWLKGLEVIDITEQLDFLTGNAVKYLLRAGHKDPAKEREDLEKAVFYVNRRIANLDK